MKLFVWENVLSDYTDGLVCVLAEDEKQAWDKLYEKDSLAWWDLQGSPDVGPPPLSESAKRDADRRQVFLYPGAIRPREVEKPEAFAVWGGG